MSQLSEIRTAVQANWPNNYHSSFLDDTKTDEYINAVLRWVARGTLTIPGLKIINHSFRWQKRECTTSTADNQQRYALPEATSTIWRYKEDISCELVNANNQRVLLDRALKRDIERMPGNYKTTDKDIPRQYAVDQGYIWLFPIPDHSLNDSTAWTVNLEYYGYPADLSGDTATNEVTNFHPEVLEYGATEMGFRYGQDYDQAEYYKNQKVEKFAEMLQEDFDSVYSNIEMGMQPVAGSGLGEGRPGNRGVYTNPTPYE